MYSTGSYINGTTFLHRIDPRIKLAFVVALSIVVLAAQPLTSLTIGLGLAALVLASGISFRTVWQAVSPLLFFIILIFLVHALFTEGEPLWGVPAIGFSVSRTGLIQGFFVSWRFLCLIVAAVLLTMTTPPSYLIAAVKFYLQPLKLFRLPVDSIAVMITLALRLMPLFLTEKNRIEIARRARGYNIHKAGLRQHIKAFLSFTNSILLGVFQKADELSAAMEARNYHLGPRTSFVELRLRGFDRCILLFSGIFLVIFIALNCRFG
jgi:energy-coupling factor transport system permease protein